MRYLVILAFLLASLLPGPATAAVAADCQFELGFAALRAAIPDRVGECLGDVDYDDLGDARQATTAWHGQGGLLYWRQADNWTGFTDGYQTWVVGPRGVEQRLNTERFTGNRTGCWRHCATPSTPCRSASTLRTRKRQRPFGSAMAPSRTPRSASA